MVSTRSPTSKSPSPFNNRLVTVLKSPITIGIIVTFMFHSFSIPLQGPDTYPFFTFFRFYSVVSRDSKVHNFANPLFFFSLFFFYKVWSSVWDKVIRLYVKVPYEFMCIIFSDRCWVGHIPFVHMVKSKFLAHFPVDHLAHPIMSSLYSCANLLHSLKLIVSSQSPHNLHLLFCCVLWYESYQRKKFLWYDSFLWRCFVLILGEILFLF